MNSDQQKLLNSSDRQENTQPQVISFEWSFAFFVGLIGIFLLIKMVHWPAPQNLAVTIIEQDEEIQHLDSPNRAKKISFHRIDYLYFPEGEQLFHDNLGETELNRDFFMTIRSKLKVKQAGIYHFSIKSDDGFRLSIDQKPICEFTQDRPMAETQCISKLSSGEHQLRLDYFQGYGYLGLEAKYAFDQHSLNDDFYWIGEDSEYVSFHPTLQPSRQIDRAKK